MRTCITIYNHAANSAGWSMAEF